MYYVEFNVFFIASALAALVSMTLLLVAVKNQYRKFGWVHAIAIFLVAGSICLEFIHFIGSAMALSHSRGGRVGISETGLTVQNWIVGIINLAAMILWVHGLLRHRRATPHTEE